MIAAMMPMHTRSTSVLAIACLAAACGSSSSSGAGGSPRGGDVGTGGSAAGGRLTGTGGSGSGGNATSAGGGGVVGGGAGGVAAGGSSGAAGGGSSGATPPSCKASGAGLSDCGPDGESCCTSLKVPGGKFYRTYKNDGSGAKDTADEATISDFRLDKYLVTVARFRKFVEAWDQGSGYTPDVGSGKHTHLNGGKGLADTGAPSAGSYEAGWVDSYANKMDLTNDTLDCQSNLSTWTSKAGASDKMPMNCINWFEAYAFCIWDGGFLASEAEYVYAAAGGSEQRLFPWGPTEPGKDNQRAIWGCYYPDGSGTCDGTTRNIAPVGTAKLGAGKWGQLDLVGNMIEWYLDYYAASYATPCTDCADLYNGSGRAPRDGYFGATDQTLLQSSYRNNGFYPANRFYSYGFRCARTP
jgi:formylglycine-generating enzyme